VEVVVAMVRVGLPVNPYDPKTGVINYIMAPAGTVVAIILYDGVAPYTPPSGTVLKQVNDNINIGAFVGT
jgi:hypothetical protein